MQAGPSAPGAYISNTAFDVSNRNWQLTIENDQGVPVFGPAGEGYFRISAFNSKENVEEAIDRIRKGFSA